ncbi:MAG: ribokinase [Lysinibacillus sp.]
MITVIGSLNMDIAIQMDVFPKQGETVLGDVFQTIPGGKGANQAVAAARLGNQVHLIGCVGDDEFGHTLLKNLVEENVNVAAVTTVQVPTGIANILIHEQDNRIIVVPGANYELFPMHIDAVAETIKNSSIVMMQLEIPIETIEYVLEICKEANVPVLFNPAPAANFKQEWLSDIAYFTPNETEFEIIFGKDIEAVLEQYPNKIIVTLGADGARYFDGEHHIHVPGYLAPVVDTTGAGDTFNGALAHALVEGQSIDEAVYFANIAASLSIGKFGAQNGMPTLEAVYARLFGTEQ